MRVGCVVTLFVAIAGCKDSAPSAAQDAAPAPEAAAAASAVESSSSAQDEPRPHEEPLDVDLRKLLAEYKENRFRADEAMYGSLIKVSGLVGDVRRGFGGHVYVEVRTRKLAEIPSLRCFIAPGQEENAASLSSEKRVTVRGRVDHSHMYVDIRQCRIISSE